MTPTVSAPRAPYALEPIAFPFPALATMAGKAPLGGPRELALACILVGRMVRDAAVSPGSSLSDDQLLARVAAAKHWLGNAAIQAPVRQALTRLCESTGNSNRSGVKAALDGVMTVTASHLDSAARLEFARLAQAIVE